jgi:predicted dehydrogenase|tara:strand:- start:1460 stop:2350 length:891 start_codon:yes stop_codon:yes gene_type:complete
MSEMKKLGIVGIGNWGKNLVRELSKIYCIKKCSSNGNSKNIKWLKKNYPSIQYVPDPKEIFTDKEINAVVIATPINTHYKLVKKALLSKKHVFVEKPISTNLSEAEELIGIAKKNNLLLFVGHIFIFNEIFKKLIQISNRENITHLNFIWNKFGTFDEDIFLNLVSHDLSIVLSLFGKPKKIKLINKFGVISKCDVVTLILELPNNKTCQIHVNRCSNQKQKHVTIFTQKNIYIWDDLSLFKNNKKTNSFKLVFQSKHTPLEIECKEFVKKLNETNTSFEFANIAKDVIQVIQKLK